VWLGTAVLSAPANAESESLVALTLCVDVLQAEYYCL